MAVDPRHPDTFDSDDGDDVDEEEYDLEAPRPDAAEQHTDLLLHRDTPLSERVPETANPADAAEQARVVELNEDDEYR